MIRIIVLVAAALCSAAVSAAEALRETVAKEVQKWAKLVKDRNLKFD